MAIGICDWGIGGVGLYKLLRKKSSVDIVYFSDTGYTPYGKVPEDELKARLSKVFAYFNSLGIHQVIVGCNAASTVLTDDPNIIGVIEHGVNLVLKQGSDEVGIVGGKRTIESEIYKTKLEAKGVKVFQRIAQPLSARIEAGDVNSEGLMEDIKDIFEPIRSVQHILLACTHYPLIQAEIGKFTGDTIFLDPAEEMVEWILNNWKIENEQGKVSWQTSGDTNQMKNSLTKLYHIESTHIENIQL
jgi:glutamate racemase